jgi:hypothetical protein
MGLSAKDAAKAVGMTKQGVIKAIKDGKISANKDARGQWDIQPAELFRVYNPVGVVDSQQNDNSSLSLSPEIDSSLSLKNTELQLKLDAALEKISALESDKEDYKNRLDAESEERRKLTMMITDQREKLSDKPVEKRKKILGVF